MTTINTSSSVNTICMICDTPNSKSAMLCRECSAPLSLVREAISQEREPQVVSVVGESNVGKTVYLGFLLDMLSQQANDFEAIPKGAYSIDVQQTVISHMAHRVFPPKTAMEPDQWYWAYYQVRKRAIANKWIDLVMPDMAGESLAAEMASPKTFRVISNLVSKSSGAVLLVDAGLAANGSSRPDFFALKMMSYIDSMNGLRHDQKIKTPIAIVLAKSDYCPECFDNPREFVRANLNRLWNMCISRFENVEYFACSVVGSLGYATPAVSRPKPQPAASILKKATQEDAEQDEGVLSEWERRFAVNGASKSSRSEMVEAEPRPHPEWDQGGQDLVVPVPLHTALQGVLEPFEWILEQI